MNELTKIFHECVAKTHGREGLEAIDITGKYADELIKENDKKMARSKQKSIK